MEARRQREKHLTEQDREKEESGFPIDEEVRSWQKECREAGV
ncbi:MAG: hypothetical protein PVG99_13980 [Desulfobacteraceae bacterium]|jgi:hypothetical protein